jgi:hypothetical protein
MTEAVPILTRHDLEAKIVKHCWEDEVFHKEFTADPAATFTKHLQVPADKLPKILVHEETPGTWHIVLPVKPLGMSELPDEELGKIAGGTIAYLSVVASLTTATPAAGSVVGVSGAVFSAVEGSVTLMDGW